MRLVTYPGGYFKGCIYNDRSLLLGNSSRVNGLRRELSRTEGEAKNIPRDPEGVETPHRKYVYKTTGAC